MDKKEILKQRKKYVKDKLINEGSGHDWFHIERVYNTSKAIYEKEGGDIFIIEMCALLHDVGDWKFSNDNKTETNEIEDLLESLQVEKSDRDKIINIIRKISFKGGIVDSSQECIEGKIVQDADRLDAIGAIGIARTFTYGGYKNNPIYDPDISINNYNSLEEVKNKKSTTINHFYEKLLKLKDKMNTTEGKRIAEERHEFMENYLNEFFLEWNFAKDK